MSRALNKYTENQRAEEKISYEKNRSPTTKQ